MIALRASRLVAAAACRAVRADVLDVDCRGDYFDVLERELGALGDDAAVDDDEGAAVVVEAISVAPLLVRVEVYASKLRDDMLAS